MRAEHQLPVLVQGHLQKNTVFHVTVHFNKDPYGKIGYIFITLKAGHKFYYTVFSPQDVNLT